MRNNSISIGGSVSQSSVVAGDQNEVRQSWEVRAVAPKEGQSEEIIRSLRELRELVARLDTADRAKLARALDDAQEEAEKATPDKEEVAGALQRVVKYAKAAKDIGQVVSELQGPLSIIADWIGTAAPTAARLFGLLS